MKKEEHSNEAAGMGFYRLTYANSKYQIIFEYERLRFTIKIKWEGAFSNFFLQHKDLPNTLKEESIDEAIFTLKNGINNGNLEFFRISKKAR
ncbi:hypothetical protein [Listeria welshimeri]|uniref:hypothetical protein n=1 Tax=Listeria welshimeri TaxID=1643 RepID=UPI0016249CE1|nr:hypothetical protein [Listeria welshimeri]MBC1640028.1 hypothetical protein [Listeria welshimeri]MBC1648427.1 hypothetical protein [Listeria welshimeri]MBC1673482.1 hypothetical protein [Listeria welshimeri]MBF2457970.1 hypothetical protein [Listeria welshimeri]MBF2570572.1 hypothetical protein [Listeria welshimeri]